MINTFYAILGAVDNKGIESALRLFSKGTIDLLNIIIGSLMGLLAVAVAVILIYYAAKFGHNNVEVAAEAKKRFKAVLVSLLLCLIILSIGLTLINTVLSSVGDAPFEVTGALLNL